VLTPGGGTATGGGYTCGQTPAVDSYSLYVALRPDHLLDDDAVEALTALVRPGDADLRIWREADRGLLRVTTECEAGDLDSALRLGHALGAEVAAACPGQLLEIGALGDEDAQVWRSVP
jgi:hypothetical protein